MEAFLNGLRMQFKMHLGPMHFRLFRNTNGNAKAQIAHPYEALVLPHCKRLHYYLIPLPYPVHKIFYRLDMFMMEGLGIIGLAFLVILNS